VSILGYRSSKIRSASVNNCLPGNGHVRILIFRGASDLARRCQNVKTVPQFAKKPSALCGHSTVHHRVHNSPTIVVPGQMKPLQILPQRFCSQAPGHQRPSSRSPGHNPRSCSSLLNKWVAVRGYVGSEEFFWEPTKWKQNRKLTKGEKAHLLCPCVRKKPWSACQIQRQACSCVRLCILHSSPIKFIIIFDKRY